VDSELFCLYFQIKGVAKQSGELRIFQTKGVAI
jgi:hypothetical protein